MSKITRNIETYDAYAKSILSRKSVLSYILMYLVPEYKGMNTEYIKQCIEDGDNNPSVHGISNDVSVDGKQIRYDICFKTKSPINNTNMYINIEPQYYDNEYDIHYRAEYYASRLIDIQKDIEIKDSNFNELKKVYSIWLIFNAKTKRNFILKNDNKYYEFEYDIENHEYHKSINDKSESVFNVIIVYLDEIENLHHKGLFELLFTIFKYNKDQIQERDKILEKLYGIIDIRKEQIKMCSLGEGIARENRLEGSINTATSNVCNLINSLNWSLEKAIETLKIDDSIKEEVIKQVKLKLN